MTDSFSMGPAASSGGTAEAVKVVDAAGTNQAAVSAGGAVKVDGSAATQPVSAASLPLPTGAATAAKQPALGAAGTASADVLSVQGVASMTALKVDASATTQPVSAASLPLPAGASTAAKQAQPGVAGTPSSDVLSVQGAASMTSLKVDASATTQPVSAAALPLPTGAATAAKQPALGTAGTAAADVVTVQGVASMTAIKVDGSAVTQPVSGTVTADTELPAAAALSDTMGNPTTPLVGSASAFWDGTQWVRWQRDVKTLTVAAATLTNVTGSASSVSLLASNAAARGRMIYNDSAATLYVKFGTSASATSFTIVIQPSGYFEFPSPCYTGAVDGIWSSATGSARVTEV